MSRSSFRSAVVAVACLAATAGAAAADPDTRGRYTMSPTEDGVVRLDTHTGAMALCRRQAGSWACKDMDDDQQRLMKEVDRLKNENELLRAQVEDFEATMGLGDNDGASKPTTKLTLPSEQDVDKAFDYLERMLEKLHDRMEKLEKKHGPKGETEL
jgi:hypothetical protein